MLPKAMVFLPAALVVCCPGVLVLATPFEVLVTAKVVCAGVARVVATRTAAVVDAPVVVAKAT